MSRYETGAPNHETNEFILVASNDQDLWTHLVPNGGSPLELWANNRRRAFKFIEDIDKIDFAYLVNYFKSASEDYERENR